MKSPGLLSLLIGFIILLTFFGSDTRAQVSTISPSPMPKVENQVSSYELFWPISAGQVVGDQFYSIKLLKENLRELFIFSDSNKVEYNQTLSEKRTVEAEKLLVVKKDYQNAKKTLDQAQIKREKALDSINKSKKQGRNILDANARLIKSLKNQQSLLNYISTQVPEDQKNNVAESVSKIDIILDSLN